MKKESYTFSRVTLGVVIVVVNLDGHPNWTEKHARWRLLTLTDGCVQKGVWGHGWYVGQQLREERMSWMWVAPSIRLPAQMEKG